MVKSLNQSKIGQTISLLDWFKPIVNGLALTIGSLECNRNTALGELCAYVPDMLWCCPAPDPCVSIPLPFETPKMFTQEN